MTYTNPPRISGSRYIEINPDLVANDTYERLDQALRVKRVGQDPEALAAIADLINLPAESPLRAKGRHRELLNFLLNLRSAIRRALAITERGFQEGAQVREIGSEACLGIVSGLQDFFVWITDGDRGYRPEELELVA